MLFAALIDLGRVIDPKPSAAISRGRSTSSLYLGVLRRDSYGFPGMRAHVSRERYLLGRSMSLTYQYVRLLFVDHVDDHSSAFALRVYRKVLIDS